MTIKKPYTKKAYIAPTVKVAVVEMRCLLGDTGSVIVPETVPEGDTDSPEFP